MSLVSGPKLDKKLPKVLYYEELEKLLNNWRNYENNSNELR